MTHVASQPAATRCPDVKSETSDRDVVHYCNTIVSAQRGYYQKQEIIDVLILCGRHNIAIWSGGHAEDKCNFMAIARHVSKYVEILVLPG